MEEMEVPCLEREYLVLKEVIKAALEVENRGMMVPKALQELLLFVSLQSFSSMEAVSYSVQDQALDRLE